MVIDMMCRDFYTWTGQMYDEDCLLMVEWVPGGIRRPCWQGDATGGWRGGKLSHTHVLNTDLKHHRQSTYGMRILPGRVGGWR